MRSARDLPGESSSHATGGASAPEVAPTRCSTCGRVEPGAAASGSCPGGADACVCKVEKPASVDPTIQQGLEWLFEKLKGARR